VNDAIAWLLECKYSSVTFDLWDALSCVTLPYYHVLHYYIIMLFTINHVIYTFFITSQTSNASYQVAYQMSVFQIHGCARARYIMSMHITYMHSYFLDTKFNNFVQQNTQKILFKKLNPSQLLLVPSYSLIGWIWYFSGSLGVVTKPWTFLSFPNWFDSELL